jgi:hypothetical protein
MASSLLFTICRTKKGLEERLLPIFICKQSLKISLFYPPLAGKKTWQSFPLEICSSRAFLLVIFLNL